MAITHSDNLIETANELCALRLCGEAIALWEEASLLRPEDPYIHYQLGLCYSHDCHAHGLRYPQSAIYHYRQALRLTSAENRLARAALLADLGSAYLLASGSSKAGLLTSIDYLGQAAEIYRRFGKLDDWAREQYNLGNAWCEMPEAEFPSKWDEAVTHFEYALSFRRREKDPERYVATLKNLGTAYRELKTGSRAVNIRRAIVCYRRAMRVLRQPIEGRKRADLHHNLGNAFLTLAGGGDDRLRNAFRAIRHLNRALIVRTKVESPFGYAATQLSRGEAFLQLAITGVKATSNLGQARVCFEEAKAGFMEARQPAMAERAQRRLNFIAEAPPKTQPLPA